MLLRMSRARLATILFAVVSLGAPLTRPARAAESPPPPDAATVTPGGPTSGPFGAVGAMAGSSSAANDPVATTTTKIGWCFSDFIGPYFLSRLGYAGRSERTIITLSIGMQIWGRIGSLRPYARASIMHQHEETIASIVADPGGAVVGIGAGVAHRSGPEGAVGVDIPIQQSKKLAVYITLEAVGDWFPDPRGPALYAFGSGAVSARYSLF
jgi:hypothetical protein